MVKGVNFCLASWTRAALICVITVPLFFLASSQTTPRTQSSFDTHARWQPVTSARSRRSYGKIEDCEQSSRVRRAISKQFHKKIGDCEHWLDKLPNSSHCRFGTKVLGCENESKMAYKTDFEGKANNCIAEQLTYSGSEFEQSNESSGASVKTETKMTCKTRILREKQTTVLQTVSKSFQIWSRIRSCLTSGSCGPWISCFCFLTSIKSRAIVETMIETCNFKRGVTKTKTLEN